MGVSEPSLHRESTDSLIYCVHNKLRGEGFSPLGETAPRRGKERRSQPLSPGSAPPTAPALVVSSISVVGGSSGGGALRKPSLCKQQSLNAKIKIRRDEILRSITYVHVLNVLYIP